MTKSPIFDSRSIVFGVLIAITAFPPASLAQSAGGARTARMQAAIDLEIGPLLDGLALSPATASTIKAFFLQRTVAVADAVDEGIRQRLPSEQSSALITTARDAVDATIDQTFVDPSKAGLVKEIVRNYVAYSQITRIHGPHMAKVDAPLSGEQMRQLAKTLFDCRSALVNPSAMTEMRTSIDAETHLSALDRKILVQAASYLSPKQLSVLQSDLAQATQAIATGQPYIP